MILLALSFRESLEATVKCKYELRRFKGPDRIGPDRTGQERVKIQNLLYTEAILSARVSLSKHSRTIRVKKKYDFNVFYDPRLFTHDPRQLFRLMKYVNMKKTQLLTIYM